jgi:glycosyltransferase involved in cell wall biosynthesis
MRIGIIVPRVTPLGPVKVMQSLVNSLAELKDVEITVFYLDKKVNPYVTLKVSLYRYNPSEFKFEDFDIIHTNGIRPDWIAFLNRRKIKKHISTIHNFVFEDLAYTHGRVISWIFGYFWLMLWRKADKLICVSSCLKAYYERWIPKSTLDVIHNGIVEDDSTRNIDPVLYQVVMNFKLRGLKIIGTSGILTKRKGIDQVIRFLTREQHFSLLIFGDGIEKGPLIHLAKKLQVYDRTFFCGFRNNMVEYYKMFDLFVMPSRSEGFGLALLEAVVQKIPVVCSDIPVFKELFNADEVTFFKLDDLESISRALKEGNEIGQYKANSAYLRYHNNYTVALMAKKYYDLYQKV